MKLFLSTFLLMSFGVFGQVNLVPNPSFENQLYCTNMIAGNLGNGVLMDWHNPNTSTPDYYNMCWLTPPPQNFVYQLVDGDGFVGICTYNANHVNIHEYVSCQLLDTLEAGKRYYVSFYARIWAGRTSYASNNLGIYFSDTTLHATNPFPFNINTPLMLEAQVKYFNNEIISDSAHWTLVSGLYEAQGGETWLTIGNFNTDEETTQGMIYTDGIAPSTYFVIDMVSVIPLDSIPGGIPAHAGADTTIFINDTAFIGQKISNMPSNWYLLDGTLIATNTAGLYVNPQETTSYVVSHTLNGIFSADTVTVTVIDNLGLEEAEKQRIELFPVPNNGNFKLVGELEAGDHVQLIQLDGKVVLEQILSENSAELELITDLISGTYLVVLKRGEDQIIGRERMMVLR
jgi:hypothetical protein